MSSKVDFLYLSEKDMVKAGVTNMKHCVEVMEEMFELLGKGDYIMGGKNGNSHGIKINFPKESPFVNMPKQGADRRFMAMVGYLGGRFNVCGEKWYGSNRDNIPLGLPRSILMIMLNDAKTGAPLSLMSGNLVSALRTGAIPGVGAKHLANEDSEVIGIIGAGVISRTCLDSLLVTCKNIKLVKIYTLTNKSAQKLKSYINENYPTVEVQIVDSMEAAVRDSDIVNCATSGDSMPYFEEEWLKEGVLLSLPASARASKEFVLKTKKVVDNWKMYEAWAHDLDGLCDTYSESLTLMAAQLMDYVKEKELDPSEILNLGDIIAGNVVGRESKEEKIIFIQGGMPVEDIAWGYTIYEKAKEMGLGVTLDLWDEPYLF